MFEKATRLKLRISTDKGYLSVEDLWDLSLQNLNRIAKVLNKDIKESDEEDFLEETTEKDTIAKLKFDIVLYILKIKKQEFENLKNLQAKKLEKEKLLNILDEKQNESLKNLSIDEIKKKINDL
jgi:hypothetical protein